jgi:hypothetical protein
MQTQSAPYRGEGTDICMSCGIAVSPAMTPSKVKLQGVQFTMTACYKQIPVQKHHSADSGVCSCATSFPWHQFSAPVQYQWQHS